MFPGSNNSEEGAPPPLGSIVVPGPGVGGVGGPSLTHPDIIIATNSKQLHDAILLVARPKLFFIIPTNKLISSATSILRLHIPAGGIRLGDQIIFLANLLVRERFFFGFATLVVVVVVVAAVVVVVGILRNVDVIEHNTHQVAADLDHHVLGPLGH